MPDTLLNEQTEWAELEVNEIAPALPLEDGSNADYNRENGY